MAMGQFSKALKDYESVFKVKPKDPDVRKKVTECRKVLFYNEKIQIFDRKKAEDRGVSDESWPTGDPFI